MTQGTVTWYDGEKGYGFVTPHDGSKAVFVHHSAFTDTALGTLTLGQRVEFDEVKSDRGPRAENLRLA